MHVNVHLVEDHCDAYLLWKEAGIKGATVVHVDAHFDCSDDFLSEAALQLISQCGTGAEVAALKESGRLAWGGYHGGNYLYPALRDGTVGRLVWVLPERLAGRSLLAFFQDEMKRELEVSLSDYRSFVQREGRIEGSLWGVPVTVATPSSLPRFESKEIILDVDADFFTSPGDVLRPPSPQLIELFGNTDNPVVVAYSNRGGYTPLRYRIVGDILAGSPGGWRDAFRFVRQLEAILEESPEAALHLLEDQYPRGFPPSHSHYWKWRILSRIGSEDADEALYRARSADPEYAPDAMSTAAYYFLRGRYGEAAGALDRLLQECEAGKIPIDPTPVYDRTRSRALYLKGLIAFRSGEIGETHRAWERILEEHISGEEKAHAAFRLGSALARHGQPGEGLAYLDMAESLGYGRNARIAHHRGIALESLGDNDGAARELRKSLRLDPFSLKSLDARLVLAGIYEKLGLASLAVSQYERLQRDDPRGFHGSIAMLKSSRISYRHSEEKS